MRQTYSVHHVFEDRDKRPRAYVRDDAKKAVLPRAFLISEAMEPGDFVTLNGDRAERANRRKGTV